MFVIVLHQLVFYWLKGYHLMEEISVSVILNEYFPNLCVILSTDIISTFQIGRLVGRIATEHLLVTRMLMETFFGCVCLYEVFFW